MEWINKDKELPPANTLIWLKLGGFLSEEELIDYNLADLIFIGIYENESLEWKGKRVSEFFLRASKVRISTTRLSKLQPKYVESWTNIEESNSKLIIRKVIIEKYQKRFYGQEEIIERVNKTYKIEKNKLNQDFIDLIDIETKK